MKWNRFHTLAAKTASLRGLVMSQPA